MPIIDLGKKTLQTCTRFGRKNQPRLGKILYPCSMTLRKKYTIYLLTMLILMKGPKIFRKKMILTDKIWQSSREPRRAMGEDSSPILNKD